MIETDYHVGRILNYLDQSGLDKNTIVIFTSDNGPENSWRNRIDEFKHRSNGPYRGGKRDIYEGGHRVPFFVRWPDGIQSPGRKWDGLVGQTDLLMTLAKITHSKTQQHDAPDSQSFATVLEDSKTDYVRLPLINHSAKGQFSITDGHWKLILPHRKSSSELYNLANDPAESKNIIDHHADVKARLMKNITEVVCNGRTTPGPKLSNDTGYWKDLAWIQPEEYESLTRRN